MTSDLCLHCGRVTPSLVRRGVGCTKYICAVCHEELYREYDDDCYLDTETVEHDESEDE